MIVGCVALTLLLAHMIRLQSDRHRVENHAERVLDAAVSTARESIDTFRQSLRLQTEPCSAEDLKELRVLAFRSNDIRDVGRIQDDRVLCTGAWGLLAAPLALPPPTRITDSHRFWSEGPSIVDSRISTDMLSAGGVILFVAPTWFDNAARLDGDIQSVVTTHDRSQVLRATADDVGHIRERRSSTWYDLGTERVADACSDAYNLCVVARTRASGLAALMPQLILGLCLLGGFAGLGVNSCSGTPGDAAPRSNRNSPGPCATMGWTWNTSRCAGCPIADWSASRPWRAGRRRTATGSRRRCSYAWPNATGWDATSRARWYARHSPNSRRDWPPGTRSTSASI